MWCPAAHLLMFSDGFSEQTLLLVPVDAISDLGHQAHHLLPNVGLAQGTRVQVGARAGQVRVQQGVGVEREDGQVGVHLGQQRPAVPHRRMSAGVVQKETQQAAPWQTGTRTQTRAQLHDGCREGRHYGVNAYGLSS